MKTIELRAAIDKLGLNLELELNTLCAKLVKDNEKILLIVSSKKVFNMQIDYFFNELSDSEREYVFNLAVEYASTPIAEREEEKRYRLPSTNRHLKNHSLVLYKNRDLITVIKDYTIDVELHQTAFTESELKTMDLTGFKKVEVTE